HNRALLDPIDGRDVGMIERGQRLRFAFEAGHAGGIFGEGRGQDLDGDVARELRIARAIYLAHPAGAERGDDFVRPQPSSDVKRYVKGHRAWNNSILTTHWGIASHPCHTRYAANYELQ